MVCINPARQHRYEEMRREARYRDAAAELIVDGAFDGSRNAYKWYEALRRHTDSDATARIRSERQQAIERDYAQEAQERSVLRQRDEYKISALHEGLSRDISQGKVATAEPPVWIGDVIENVPALELSVIEHLQQHSADFAKLPWDVSEHLFAEFFSSQGWTDVRLVGRDPRTSADIFVSNVPGEGRRARRVFVEIKQHKSKVGIEIVQSVLGAYVLERPKYEWQYAVIISPRGFKKFRKTSTPELRIRGIELKDGGWLLGNLKSYKPNRNGLWLPHPRRQMPD